MSEISSKKIWVVGDRCQIITPKKYSGEKGYVSGFHTDDSPEIWVKLDNHDLQIRVLPEEIKSSEETARLKINKSKPSDCWYTPPEIVDLIQQCLNGITLDPCADDDKHIESCQHLTADDDGLSHQWSGRVFMNPPYSCPGLWIAKLQEEFNCGRVEEAIALVPVATDTNWFHPLISSNLICFWKGRIKFLNVDYQPKMPARQSHCLIYWGKNQSRFREIFSSVGSFNFLEEEGAIASCNSNMPASLQESEALNSELMPPEHPTSLKLNSSLKITPTPNESSNTDFLVSPSIATSRTTTQSWENSTSTQLDFLVQGHQSQGTEPDLTTQNQNSGLKLCDVSPTVAPVSSSLKILQDLSTKDYEELLGDSEWLAMSGMIRKSYQLRNSDRPKREKGFSSLPTPTTYAKGSTGCRPAGATRLEQKLRPYITKGDKLNPAVPGWMMGFPVGWAEWPLMDTGETISVQLPFIPEFVTTSTNDEIAMTSTLGQSAPSRQQLQLSESVTLPISPTSPLTRANTKPETYIIDQHESLGIIKQNLGFGFVVDWLNFGKVPNPSSGKNLTYDWERDNRVIAELAIAPQSLIDKFLEDSEPLVLCPSCELQHIYLSGGCGMCGLEPDMQRTDQLQIDDESLSGDRLSLHAPSPSIECTQELQCVQVGVRVRITKTRTQNLSQWVGKTATVTGINGETISVAAGEGREKKYLTLKKGWYELIPENFLEEKQEDPASAQQPKPSKQKGCLYRYLENKRLKDGTIASYPRVIGDRKPDNPTHWRWGFNWEEKVDSEWKGRSIGSVPVGAIALIQSMQNEGVSLEEIIGFIKRAKAKKC